MRNILKYIFHLYFRGGICVLDPATISRSRWQSVSGEIDSWDCRPMGVNDHVDGGGDIVWNGKRIKLPFLLLSGVVLMEEGGEEERAVSPPSSSSAHPFPPNPASY